MNATFFIEQQYWRQSSEYRKGILQGSTDGDLSAELEIRLAGAPQLVASDIIL